MIPTFKFDGLETFLKEFEDKKPIVETGVVAEGAPAAYAHVWEYGNHRQTKQGPRTVRGINPDGEVVWLSSQAPLGYIAVNLDKYVDVIKEGLGNVRFDSTTATEMVGELEKASQKIMTQVAKIMEETAPVDIGDLKGSFTVVDGGDDAMKSDPGGSIKSRFNRVLNIKDRG